MDFKLFLPLASTLVVGGTFTVFYMGYLKNKEIRERKPTFNMPKLDSLLTSSDQESKEEKPEDESRSEEKPQLESGSSTITKTESKAEAEDSPAPKVQSEGSSSEPDKSSTSQKAN